MKKYVVLLVFTILALISCASTSGPFLEEYEVVIEVPEKTKDELYVIANTWAVDAFISSEAVIDFSDKEAGVIKGSFTSPTTSGLNNYNTETTITINTRDGAARILFNNPKEKVTAVFGKPVNGSSYSWMPCKNTSDRLEKMNSIWILVAEDFKYALLNDTSNNW